MGQVKGNMFQIIIVVRKIYLKAQRIFLLKTASNQVGGALKKESMSVVRQVTLTAEKLPK